MTPPSASHPRDPIVEAESVLQSAEIDGRHIPMPARHQIHGSARLEVGDDMSINHGERTIIRNDRLDLAGMQVREQDVRSAPIPIRDDAQLDASARILSGGAGGSEAIVSTSAFVGHDVKPQPIAGGRPYAVSQGVASVTTANRSSVAMFSDARIGIDLHGRIASNDPGVYGEGWLRGLRGDDHFSLHVRVDFNPGSGTNSLNGNIVALPYYVGLASFVRHAPSLLRAIQSAVSRADVVVTRLPGLIGLCASTIALMSSKPLATELVGDPYESLAATGSLTRRVMGFLNRVMTRSVLRRVSVVRYVTQRVLQESYPAGTHAKTAAASSVNLDLWLVGEVVPESPAPTVIAVGTQEQLYKGHADLISAIAIMRGMGFTSKLVLVGDGKYNDFLRRHASEAGIAEDVHFVGYINDVVKLRRLIDQAWVYAMPSHTEGLPRSLVEAMARGKACVGTDVGGIRELLSPDYRVARKDPMKLAAVLTRLLRDPSERQQAGSLNAGMARDFAVKTATNGAAWADAVDSLRGIPQGPAANFMN